MDRVETERGGLAGKGRKDGERRDGEAMLVQTHPTVDDAVATDDAVVGWSSREGSVEEPTPTDCVSQSGLEWSTGFGEKLALLWCYMEVHRST